MRADCAGRGVRKNESSQWDARKASTRPGRRRQIVFGDCLPSFIWWGGEVFGTQTRKSIMVATDGLFDIVSVSGLPKIRMPLHLEAAPDVPELMM